MGQGHVLVDAVDERCILVGVISGSTTEAQAEEYLDELQFLALTAGAISEKRFVQKLQFPNPKTYVGSGKLEEIRKYVESNAIDLVIIDDELSPSQARNIEKVLGVLILDRNNLILDIFASRARTASAKTQVELAQMQYLLPRLTNLWTHLDRQKGGIGMRGPGETEIETDRRIIQQKIALLKAKLKAIDKQKKVQRGNRGQLVRVALVGYTNVGKSTIMNMLSKSDVFAENKLFATLDTTVRKVVIENLPFLLADTVGFIRKLPHQLVDSFKSTLDEVRESDLLVHVLDISHANFEDQYEVVKKTLAEIDTEDKPTVVVFNKIDAYDYVEKEEDDMTPMESNNYSLEDLRKTWMNKLQDANCVFISAQNKENIDELKKVIYGEVKSIFQERYPYHHFLY
ncbi:GTPase HflX [Crocinitomicaceae bacterium]|jgi:GTP-binding protein HflX|nr:GTPase HflX [Crocinitomicaceae bacterium]MDA9881852.1 GTPase HflX [Crocinitomicaceae bacterium]MDB2479282.1 GTPase HflX [Crocinitomicaceae bacterium]MDG1037085.1 GTPase HflX [Crocinitomicaceae bacterium]